MLNVVSRVVGVHKLLLLNFYPFLQVGGWAGLGWKVRENKGQGGAVGSFVTAVHAKRSSWGTAGLI